MKVVDESIKKVNETINEIAKILQKKYGKYWNFEIDFVEGDPERNYTLRVKVYRRVKKVKS